MVLKKLEKAMEDVISRGGDVVSDKLDDKDWTNFTLRIRKDLSISIDKVLDERIGISKTGWILEAIQEKLRRKDES